MVIPLVFMEDRVDGQRNSNGRQMRLDGLLDVLVVEGFVNGLPKLYRIRRRIAFAPT